MNYSAAQLFLNKNVIVYPSDTCELHQPKGRCF
jgi:hypothetical protein